MPSIHFRKSNLNSVLKRGRMTQNGKFTERFSYLQDFVDGEYYINKAINIDVNNVAYWKLYAQINQRLNVLEDAEHGYKKTLELGNYELDTWVSRGDNLMKLGEDEAAISNFKQCIELLFCIAKNWRISYVQVTGAF